MPKEAKKLNALQVKALKHPGGKGYALFAVGGAPGLHLQISSTGARSWILRIVSGGKRHDLGLGSFNDVSLDEARDLAHAHRKSVREWKAKARFAAVALQAATPTPVADLPLDPITALLRAKKAKATRAVQGLTFAQAADKFLRNTIERGEDGNKKHKAQWRSTLEKYAFPIIGKRPIAEITVADVFDVLDPIWLEKAETASRVRQRIEKVLHWAAGMDYRSGENPAALDGKLGALLPKAGKKVAVEAHHPAVAIADARRWWEHLGKMDGQGALALRLAVLCACRSGEVRGLTWGEVEFGEEGPERIVFPASRMKAKTPHIVPLSPAAVAVLRAAAALRDGEAWPDDLPSDALVFPAARGGQLSDMTLSAVMRRMHEAETEEGRPGYLDTHSRRPAVPHGCRSTFRDWAGQEGYPRDLAEEALAHTIGNAVEAAYARSQRAELRKPMMQAWADFLSGEKATGGGGK